MLFGVDRRRDHKLDQCGECGVELAIRDGRSFQAQTKDQLQRKDVAQLIILTETP